MTKKEALEILGLDQNATKEDILKSHQKLIKKNIDPDVIVKFDNNKKLDGVKRKKLNVTLANQYGWKSKMNFSKVLQKIINDFRNLHN